MTIAEKKAERVHSLPRGGDTDGHRSLKKKNYFFFLSDLSSFPFFHGFKFKRLHLHDGQLPRGSSQLEARSHGGKVATDKVRDG